MAFDYPSRNIGPLRLLCQCIYVGLPSQVQDCSLQYEWEQLIPDLKEELAGQDVPILMTQHTKDNEGISQQQPFVSQAKLSIVR